MHTSTQTDCGCSCSCTTRTDSRGVPAPERHPCIVAADAVLGQAGQFLAELDPAAYVRPCALASNGTIGKHVRHCLDHYRAALAGHGPIDYDHRERDVPMETDIDAAMTAIAKARSRLRDVPDGRIDEPVSVRVMLDADGRTVDLRSTLGRELAFAMHHALHHHAIMKFIAGSFGVDAPDGFGKAPSTINHERLSSATLLH